MKKLLFILATLISTSSVYSQTLPIYLDNTKPIEQRVEDALGRMTLQEKIRVIHAQSKFSSAGVPRLGIPDFWTDDGPHGVRPNVLWDDWRQAGQNNDSCVAFPALTCLAATWNPQMASLYGKALGEEARYRGKDMILGPGVNINRTPLGGRNFEYMGEDPYLVSIMVVPYIKGLQSKGVSACVKHYCLNNDEENRHHVNVIVSERALREIYLPAFKAAVDSGVWAVMGSYNLYKNFHNCQNPYLLNGILKKEWKFDGVVVSDWGGTHSTDEAVNNGLDMEFGTGTDGLKYGKQNAYDGYYMAMPFLQGIKDGKYTQAQLDEKVRRVLRLFFRTTMISDRPLGFLCSESHYDAARKVADEGIVLLKNRGDVLPIRMSKAKRILVVGENAIKMLTVGGGSSSLKVQKEITPLSGLKAVVEGHGCVLEYERGYVGDTTGEYNGVTTGQNLKDNRSQEQLVADAVAKAKDADYVIMFGGLNKSDYQDAEGHDRKKYELPYNQDKLIEALARVNNNFVYVNLSGDAVAMPWENKVPAIVQGWYLGSESGEALADVLLGKVNPSGKLTYTWFKSLNDVPAHKLNTYPGTWRKDHIIDEEYKEGVSVGYRSVEKYKITPTFAFGHGLSYTTFKISDVRASSKDITRNGVMTFTVNVKNSGKMDGAETVQLYIHDNEASVDRPYMELKGFKKVFLKAGESKDVSVSIDNRALSFFDEASHTWKSENGSFTALIGDASDNISQKISFNLIGK